MPVQAKISPTNAGLGSAPVQVVEGSVTVPAGSSVVLNVAPAAVEGYAREGTDLLVHLKSGEVVRVTNFYLDPSKISHLLLVQDEQLLAADLGQVASGAIATPAYVPIDATAGFAASAAPEVAAAGAAGAAGGGIGTTALAVLGGLGAAGLAAAAAGGGGKDAPPPDTTAPGAATNLAINAAGDRLTGSAEAGATVNVDTDGNGTSDYSATVGSNGTFTVTLAPPLLDGEVVRVTVRDAAGNVSPSASVTAPDTTGPDPIETVSIASDGTSLTGTGTPGDTVHVDIDGDGEPDYTTVIGASGTFHILFAIPLDNGQQIDVTLIDPAGNPSDPVVVSAPDLSPSPTTAPVLDPTNGSVFTGTAQSGVAVVLTDASGNTIGQATIAADGTWSFTPQTPLPDGTVITAAAVNQLAEPGPSATVTVDAVAPPAPIISPSDGEAIGGTAEPGATILLTDADGDPIGQAIADGSGAWSITLANPLPDGTVVTAVARDAAGNVGSPASVTIDAIAPTPPTVAPASATVVSGTAEPGSTVLLTDGNGNPIGQATTDAGGNWSFSPVSPLADGTVITIVARDAAGNSSTSITTTVDAVAPATPSIAPTNGLELSGTAEPGTTLTLTDGGGNPIGQVVVAGNGSWSFTPASPLPNGTVVNAVATDAAGNASPPATTTVDTIPPPAPAIDPGNGEVVSGTAEPGATITLTDDDGNPIGEVLTAPDGTWSFTPAEPFPDGTVLHAVATDAAGNTGAEASTTVDAVAPDAPTIDATNGVEVTGTAEPGSTVILTDGDGAPIAEVTTDDNGDWRYDPSSPLPDGTVVNAVAQDAAGNTGPQASTTVDGAAPDAPVVNPTNGFVLTGTAEPDALVTLTDGNGNPIGQVVAAIDGNWSFTPGSPLPDGTVVDAVAQDAVGNISEPGSAIVDAVAPDAPVIDASNGAQVTGSAEIGATVLLTDDDGNPIGETIADDDGAWSFTPPAPLPEGTVVHAVAQDAAGNVSPEASTTVDATAPDAPVIDASDGTQLTGTAEVGATLTLTDGDGDPIGEVTVDIDGNWSFTPSSPLAEGTVVNAVARDAAGNDSPPSSTTVDTSPPAAPTIDPTNGSQVTGTAEPNSTVVLMDGTGNSFARGIIPNLGLPLGEVIADEDGNWTFTPLLQLPDGTVVIAVSVDAAGNVSGPVSTIVDGVAPLTPTIDPSTGLALEGTAEAGVRVLLTDLLGDPIGETTADEDGNWTFTPILPLPNGTLVHAVALDEAGNASPSVSTIVDSLVPLAPVIDASNGLTLTGTAEPDARVILTDGLGNPVGETTADENGDWSFTPLVPLLNATFVIAVAQDAAGNTSLPAITSIDTLPPASPILSLSPNGGLLTGFAEPNSRLEIVIDGDTDNPIVVNVDGSGTFTLPLLVPLILGESISAVTIDAAGNQSPPANLVAPDIAPPDILVPEAGDGWVNAAETADGIEVEVTIRPTMQVGQVVTAHFVGQGGYQVQASHTLTAGDFVLGAVLLDIVPTGGLGPLPDGPATITATVGSGAASTAVAFTIDATPPTTPLLALTNSVLTVSTDPNTELTVSLDIGGTNATANLVSNVSGIATLNLLTDLDIDLGWDQLLNAQASVTGTDQAGNPSNVATLAIGPAIEQPVTIGNFAVDVSLNPLSPRFGFTGTTEPGSSVVIRVVTPLLNVQLLPVTADSNGHFSLNLLSPTILSQLQLSIFDILNLGPDISIGLVATDPQGNESAGYLIDLTAAPLSLNIGQIDITGTAGEDVLSGSTGSAEHINALGGSDLIYNVGTGDHVIAGGGDDTVQITATNFVSVDGGTGFDTILLANGIDLDYGLGVGTFANIERIDLGTGDSGSVLTLTASEVNAITDASHVLQITGESNDVLHVTGAVDTGTSQAVNGIVYDVYTFGASQLLVEENTVQVVV